MIAGVRRAGAKSWLALSAVCLPFSCGRLGYELTDLPRPALRGDAMGAGGGSGANGVGGSPAAGSDSGSNAGGSGGGVPQATGGVNVDSGAAGRGGTGSAGPSTGGVSPDSGTRDASSGAGGRLTDAGAGGGGADARPPVEAGFPTCSITRTWTQSFDSDPTQSDNDTDGTNDWIVRGGAPFPVSELSGGVWHATNPVPIDSRPFNDFSARTIVDVRFRSLTVPASNRGAVFWINLNENGPAFSALFASLVGVTGGGQELTLFGKTGAIEVPIAVFPNLSDSFVDLHLDIDPVAKIVAVWIGGATRGTYAIPETSAPNADAFATVLSWEGSSEFDEVKIVVCSP